MSDNTTTDGPITREDLEASIREVSGEISGKADDAKPKLLGVAIGGGLLLLFIVYLLGKRVGKTKATVVEVRRI